MADLFVRLTAEVVAVHPVERVYLDFGEAETWEVARDAGGWALRRGDRFEVSAPTRAELTAHIRTHLGHRLLTLGERVLADQRA